MKRSSLSIGLIVAGLACSGLQAQDAIPDQPSSLSQTNSDSLPAPAAVREDEVNVQPTLARSPFNGAANTLQPVQDVVVAGQPAWRYREAQVQPPVPEMILISAITGAEKKNLTEDLQVLERLLSRAVSVHRGSGETTNTAMGITLYRSDESSNLTWIQNSGLLFRQSFQGISFAAVEGKEPAESTKPSEESEWDSARRELFASAPIAVWGMPLHPEQVEAPQYDARLVDQIRTRIEATLGNLSRIRFPASSQGQAQVVTVSLSCPLDGSHLTVRCTVTPGETTNEIGPFSTHRYIEPVESQAVRVHNVLGVPALPSLPFREFLPPKAVAPAIPGQPIQPPQPAEVRSTSPGR